MYDFNLGNVYVFFSCKFATLISGISEFFSRKLTTLISWNIWGFFRKCTTLISEYLRILVQKGSHAGIVWLENFLPSLVLGYFGRYLKSIKYRFPALLLSCVENCPRSKEAGWCLGALWNIWIQSENIPSAWVVCFLLFAVNHAKGETQQTLRCCHMCVRACSG